MPFLQVLGNCRGFLLPKGEYCRLDAAGRLQWARIIAFTPLTPTILSGPPMGPLQEILSETKALSPPPLTNLLENSLQLCLVPSDLFAFHDHFPFLRAFLIPQNLVSLSASNHISVRKLVMASTSSPSAEALDTHSRWLTRRAQQ
jgi:hypothetical protein